MIHLGRLPPAIEYCWFDVRIRPRAAASRFSHLPPDLPAPSRVSKAIFLFATVRAMGFAILSVGIPVPLFADVTAPPVEKSALHPPPDQWTPTIHSTADAQPLPLAAKDAPTRDEIAAASES